MIFFSPSQLKKTSADFVSLLIGHTSRPADFCWAPGESESWHVASVSEDNVLQVWQPSRRIWAGEDVDVDARELEGEAMEGVEAAGPAAVGPGKAREE